MPPPSHSPPPPALPHVHMPTKHLTHTIHDLHTAPFLASTRPGRVAAVPVRAAASATIRPRAPAAARRAGVAVSASATIVPVKTAGTKEKVKIGINGEPTAWSG